MLGQNSFGGITATGQSTAQAVSATAAQLVFTNGSAMPSTSDRVGAASVRADTANNRLLLNAPGIYRVDFCATGSAASALQTTFQMRKNSATAFGRTSVETWGTTPATHTAVFIVEITAADIPAAGGQPVFADPSAAVGAYKPGGGFAGAGAAPLTEIPVDVLVTGNGSVNFTMTEYTLFAERIG